MKRLRKLRVKYQAAAVAARINITNDMIKRLNIKINGQYRQLKA